MAERLDPRYTIAEAAPLVGKTEAALRQAIYRGTGPETIKAQNRRLILRSALAKWAGWGK